MLELRVLLQLDLEDTEKKQFDDVLDPLDRRTRRPKLLVKLLQDVVRIAVSVMYCRTSHLFDFLHSANVSAQARNPKSLCSALLAEEYSHAFWFCIARVKSFV